VLHSSNENSDYAFCWFDGSITGSSGLGLIVELVKTFRTTGHGQWRKEAALSSKLFTAWLATLIVEPPNSMTDIRLILHPP
jgi:hypothetical protein